LAMTDFLQNILDEGVKSGWFSEKKIGALDKSCCSSATEMVIDFDEFKDKFHKGGQTPSSCDGLKILPAHERLDFIEMKGLKKFIGRSNADAAKLDGELETQIADFDFPKKIIDSLDSLSKWLKTNPIFNSNSLDDVQKQFIILTDIDPSENAVQFISLNFDFFGLFSENMDDRIHRYFEEKMVQFPAAGIRNFKRPLLKTCLEMDDFYSIR
jgi:hypothetical protein